MLKFQTEDEEINKKIFPFDGPLSIKDMLYSFLSQTNSKNTLDPNKISFMFCGHMLNSDSYLKKTVAQVFTKKNNAVIKVTDTANVIGGITFLNFYEKKIKIFINKMFV